MTRSRQKEREPIAAIFRAAIFAAYVIPLFWIVLTSVKSPADVIGTQASIFFQPTLGAYESVLAEPALYTGLLQSVLISTGTTVLVLTISIPAGFALARSNSGAVTAALGLLIVLQMIPQTANVIPLYQLFASARILDTTASVVLANTALLTPFAILLMRPFFRGIPIALEEASAIDGASMFRTFWSVMVPLTRNGIATTGTLIFLIAWGEFLYAINFFVSPSNYPLSALLASRVSAFGIDWPGLMALAVLTSVPILIVFALTYRLLREGLTVGAVK